MSEEEIDQLVKELKNNPVELNSYVASFFLDANIEEIEAKARELENDDLELREFVLNNLV